jgi:hypothetical protein
MKLNIGDYRIESDSQQFVVKSKRIIQNSEKEGLNGEEAWTPKAYCVKFDEALRWIPQEALRTNDDIVVIKDKLDRIQADIKAITLMPVIFVKADNEIIIKKDIYESLMRDSNKLDALECGGVDNWSGYGYAMKEYFKNEEEKEGTDNE